jgi:flagellar hook-basal body complex protein FliE
MKINDFIPSTKIFDMMDQNKNSEVQTDNNNNVDFGSVLLDKLNDVNNEQINADNATEDFLKGGDTDIHDVMLSTEEARLSLDLAVQIRNKVMDAYQELNKMQI